ncbi:MAG: replication-relaxation family protein [Candidatus Aenigmatarchaeota archaeon]
MDVEDYSFVMSGSFRRKVFMELKHRRTLSQLAKTIKASTTQVSRALKQLEQRGLVECLSPNSRMGKIYNLTKKGRALLVEIEKDSH